MYNSRVNFTEQIKLQAIQIGFDAVGITGAEPLDKEHVDCLKDWLAKGCAAGMNYMHKNIEKRINPSKLLPAAKSIICVALNYTPPKTNDEPGPKASGRVADYALYQDYHDFMKQRLFKLTDFIITNSAKEPSFKVCVDSAPLAERALAQRAGLGFIGKNHMLIHPKLGSQILLGQILTDIDLVPDPPTKNHCPDCCKCIRACPTGAIGFDGSFDARKCISYLTIEHKGKIPPQFTEKIGSRLFGCDECILACPYQINAPTAKNKNFIFRSKRRFVDLEQLLVLDSRTFEEEFADTVPLRTGLERLKRNAEICLKNHRDNQGIRKVSSSSQGDSIPR